MLEGGDDPSVVLAGREDLMDGTGGTKSSGRCGGEEELIVGEEEEDPDRMLVRKNKSTTKDCRITGISDTKKLQVACQMISAQPVKQRC